ncbi:MAG TPA: cytochrome c biogenesis protein ResB [Actinomycetes bacterium]|nr:cytochrome c biogenesis protein ResB [Actinomycetes bacterium]
MTTISSGRTAEAPTVAPDLPDRTPPRLPELGPLELLRWMWRQLTSMRVALILLFLLALAAVPGSVIPQTPQNPAAVRDFVAAHPDAAPWLQRLGLFNVFGSIWFAAIYLLLFMSLIGCFVPRSWQHAAALRAQPPATPRNLSRLPGYRTFRTTAEPVSVVAAAGQALRRARFRVVAEPGTVRAEKGYLRDTGNLLFHLAVLGLLVAFAAGKMYGFRGSALVVEGDGFTNTVTQYDTLTPGRMLDPDQLSPFTLKLADFSARYLEAGPQRGQPADFAAVVDFSREPGAPMQTARIRVNHPLELGGVKIFLGAHGYAPVVTVRDADGAIVFHGAVPFIRQEPTSLASGGVIKVPDAVPEQLGFDGFFLPTAAFDPNLGPISTFPAALNPRLVLTGWRGDLGLDAGIPQSVYRLDTRKLTQLRAGSDAAAGPWRTALAPGQRAKLPGGLGSITFDGYREWVNLDIAKDPGRLPALASAALALLGLLLSLSIRRRRVWVRASADEAGRTVVELGALARTEAPGLDGEVDRLAARLRERLGVADGDGGSDRVLGTGTDLPVRDRD